MIGFSIWAKLVAMGATVVVLLMAVHAYNVKVTTKAVLKAEAKMTAVYKPKFEGLTKQFNDLRTQVITDRLNTTSAANAAIAQGKLDALLKTNAYLAELSKLKTAAAHDADLWAGRARTVDERLRDTIRPLATGDGTGQQGIRLSGYTDGLGSLYGQCENDVGILIVTAAGALDRLAEAEAAVRALKP